MNSALTAQEEIEKARSQVHKGMPPLHLGERPISPFEFWPAKVFYFPIALQWMALSIKHGSLTLPTVANTSFPLGGLVGESKASVMDVMQGKAKERFADFYAFVRNQKDDLDDDVVRARKEANDNDLFYPFVAKPDRGCRGAGVQLIKDDEGLKTYLDEYPEGHNIIFQQYIPYEAEAGIFYIRRPGEKKGAVTSLTLKYFPYVFGDGASTLEELILAHKRSGPLSHIYLPRHSHHLDMVLREGEPFRLAFAGSHSRGTIFRNGNEYITDAMSEAFDEVADGIPGFHFGRFDARFPSLEDLQNGGEFHLMEINGAGGESTHIWDSRTTLFEAYRTLAGQFRTLFEIGAANRKLGYKPSSIREIYDAWRLENELTDIYPPTE